MWSLHVGSAAGLLLVELFLADGDGCVIRFLRRAARTADNGAPLLIRSRVHGLA